VGPSAWIYRHVQRAEQQLQASNSLCVVHILPSASPLDQLLIDGYIFLFFILFIDRNLDNPLNLSVSVSNWISLLWDSFSAAV
jgi:hypothetical protein